MSICNKDCFHCPYPDCINDEMDHDDYVESAARDKELKSTPEKRKLAAKQRAYYEANREKLAAKQRAYREANREKVAAQQRAYREANREKVAAQKRAYREANREKVAAQKRAYYEANREKVAAQQRAYYEANREKVAAQQRAYYEANREKVAAQQKIVRDTRTALGLSQKKAAEILGVSKATVSLWENGNVPCDTTSVVLALRSAIQEKPPAEREARQAERQILPTANLQRIGGKVNI